MQTKSDVEQMKKFHKDQKRNTKLEPTPSLINKNIELSQMSEWTDKGHNNRVSTNKNFIPRALKQIEKNEKKLNSAMDREGLANELHEYKKFSLQQYEQIRLLKVEIMKIKKIAGMSKNDINQEQKDGNPKWMTH